MYKKWAEMGDYETSQFVEKMIDKAINYGVTPEDIMNFIEDCRDDEPEDCTIDDSDLYDGDSYIFNDYPW